MIYTKPIDQITYEDVLRFCEELPRENIHLDYKQAIDTSLSKTIAAMANTWGGVILVGVADNDSRPALPIAGVGLDEHLRERVNNIVLGNISPAVFPEVQVCPFDENRKAVIVIRVAQSNITPHAIRGNTRVYVRTDTSNEPEELATVDRVAWLVDRRERSVTLRQRFYERADERFSALSKKAGFTIEHADVILTTSPLYPFEALVNYRELRENVPDGIKVRAHHGSEFPALLHRVEFVPTQDGVYAFFSRDDTKYICYEELNHYGFLYHREDMANARTSDTGEVVQTSFLHSLMVRLDLWTEAAEKLYERLGYWGLIELRVEMSKLQAVQFIDLPAPRGRMKLENVVKTPVDERLAFKRELRFADLKARRPDVVSELVSEVAWAIGFSYITPDKVKTLLVEAGRA